MKGHHEMVVVRCDEQGRKSRPDLIAVEEPLEIRLSRERLTVLMRTPGDDFDLAAGFVLSEGLLSSPEEIQNISRCPNVSPEDRDNVVLILPANDKNITPPERRFYASSACGLCGKSSIESVVLAARPICSSLLIQDHLLRTLGNTVHEAQAGFKATGALHAAGLFDRTGRLLCAREDVGRHNAVDKVIGALAMEGKFPLTDHILWVSGRASFEICQKAAMVGIPIIAAVSAPSSLAIRLAQRVGITLVGFLRQDRYNIYCGAQRIQPPG